MITNQEAINRETNVSRPGAQDDKSVLAPAASPAGAAEAVISAYTAAAAHRGSGAGEKAFDAAVRAYIGCYPETHRDVAARIVADIISHRS